MNDHNSEDLGFNFKSTKKGEVLISHFGKTVTILRKHKAADFLEKTQFAEFHQQQQIMARMTGNYKRGNEKPSKQ